MRFVYKKSPDRLFFTSDTHFLHTNIIKFCGRPFESVSEMDLALIEKWNTKVPFDADVIHHGDLCWSGNIDYIETLIHTLHGRIHLILGNHDYKNRLDREVIKEIIERKGGSVSDIINTTVVQDDNQQIISCHYPMLFWPERAIMAHGHIHSGPTSTASEKASFHPMRYDVGVDNNNYEPISYLELKDIIDENKARWLNQKE